MKNIQTSLAVTWLLVGVVAPAAVLAESSFQCDKGIVRVGDSSYTVKQKCGDPQSEERLDGGGAESVVRNWYYGGGAKIPYLLRIEGGKLVNIERLER